MTTNTLGVVPSGAGHVGTPRLTWPRLLVALGAFGLTLTAFPWLYGYVMRGAWFAMLAPSLLSFYLLGKWPTVLLVLGLLPLQLPVYRYVGADGWQALTVQGGWAWPIATSFMFFVMGRRQEAAAEIASQRDRLARMQVRLEESESRFRHLTEAASEAIVVHDKGLILDVNPAMVALSGWSREELIGQRVMNITAPESVDEVLANIKAGGSDPYEMVGLTKSGGRVALEVHGKAMPWDGRQVRVTLIRDVTWRKEAEERLRRSHEVLEATVAERTQELRATNVRLEDAILAREQAEHRAIQAQKLESLGLLTGGVAHDFNNLLAALIGRLELAQQSLPAGAPAAEHLVHAEVVATRAAELVNLLLAYSGRAPTTRQPLDLGALAAEVADIARLAYPKTASLTVAVATEPLVAVADSGQARQVVLNLLTNAAEALVGGRGTVALSVAECPFPEDAQARCLVAPTAAASHWVRLRVGDDGAGMDADTIARMFDPFFSTKPTGHGLGLSAVVGIVRAHGGALAVESTPGAGTTIDWWLPLAPPRDDQMGAQPPAAVSRVRGRVLVVDDEDAVRDTVAEILTRDGWQVSRACDGEEALRLCLGSELPDAVLLDVSMPVMDGAETLAALRARHPELPVLLMSGYSAEETRQRFEGLGAPPILHKPFKAPVLLAALGRLLDGSDA